jgi:hypothetical protein
MEVTPMTEIMSRVEHTEDTNPDTEPAGLDGLAIFGRGFLHICVKFQAAAFRRARSM